MGIALFEPREAKGTVISEYPDHGAVGSQVEARNSPMMDVLHRRPDQPLVIADIATDPLVAASRAVLQRVGVRRADGDRAAHVGADGRHRRFRPVRQAAAVHADDDRNGATMVAQAATGLQNIRLLTDAQQPRRPTPAHRRLRTVGAGHAQPGHDPEHHADRQPGNDPDGSDADHALRPALGKLRVVGQYDGSTNSVDLENGAEVALDGTPTGQVWQTQELIAIDDTQAGHEEGARRSLVVAPIRSRGRLLGTVSVGSLRPYSYSETDQAIFLK